MSSLLVKIPSSFFVRNLIHVSNLLQDNLHVGFFQRRTKFRAKLEILSKWVSKFSPSQKHVHLTGYFKHHTGGGQLPKIMCEIL